MTGLIEPSDAERASLPDATRDYLHALEAVAQAAEARAEEAERKLDAEINTTNAAVRLADTARDRAEAAEAANATLTAQVEEMRGALEPFANLAASEGGDISKAWPDDPPHWTAKDHEWGRRVTVQMLRDARQALALPRGEG